MGMGTANEIGIVIDWFDFNVPYKILGTKSLSFVNKNLKNAELFPGLYNFNYLSVEN